MAYEERIVVGCMFVFEHIIHSTSNSPTTHTHTHTHTNRYATKTQAMRVKNRAEGQWNSQQLRELRDEGIHRRKELEKGMVVAQKRETRRQIKEKQRKFLAQNQFALADIELQGQKLGYGIDTESILGKMRLRMRR